jgi:cobalt-zinc-cadmium efflux system membrane fusion protein
LLNISTGQVEEGGIGTTANIYAPISGSITRVNAAVGSFVSPQTEIIEIVNNDHIHLELMVFEKDIMKLKKGQVIKFKIPESSEEEFEAEIYLIGNTIDAKRTVQVHAHLFVENQTHFIVGMFAEARVEVGIQKFSAVPKSAIAGFGSDSKILVLENTTEDDYHFRVVGIDINRYEDDLVAISSSDADLSESQILLNGARLAINQ